MRPPALTHPSAAVFLGDCLDVLAEMPDNSVDAIVTDPPYGLEFMGKDWDAPWKRGDDINADAGMTSTGYTDGGNRLPRPTFTGSTNPKCQVCGGTRRGRRDGTAKVKVCLCTDGGRFPNVRAAEMLAFQQWCEGWTTEALRVLKPGGHLLAFGGTRTWHRLAVAVEDAGFEVRDSIAWLYGSGFPKSLDVSKAIDKKRDEKYEAERREIILTVTTWIAENRDRAGISNRDIDAAFGFAGMAGHWTSSKSQPSVPTAEQWPALLNLLGVDQPPSHVRDAVDAWLRIKGQPCPTWDEREVLSERVIEVKGGNGGWSDMVVSGRFKPGEKVIRETAPATPAAQQWAGWGTALKPAFEPIVVARKPLVGTVAANVLEWGTGALNVDATRVPHGDDVNLAAQQVTSNRGDGVQFGGIGANGTNVPTYKPGGRWPANVLLDGDAAAELDGQSGIKKDSDPRRADGTVSGSRQQAFGMGERTARGYGGEGGASRFFPVFPRDFECCENGEHGPLSQAPPALPTFRYQAKAPTRERPTVVAEDGTKTAHPTVKPLALMRWLVRLVTPPGGTVLDTFTGSGATIEAAIEEGFYAMGIEREESYLPLIQVRLDRVTAPASVANGEGAA